MRLELTRLNHILIPTTKSGRDRYRATKLARRLRALFWVWSRLSREGRAFFGIACVAAVFGLDVVRTDAHVLVLATFSLLLASLPFTRLYRLQGVKCEARAPRRVTLGERLEITLSLANAGARKFGAIRVEAPLLPWDGAWLGGAPAIPELRPGGRASATLAARFLARGEHHLDPMRVAALVPLGLVQGPALASDGVRFTVVPRIARVVSVSLPRSPRHHPGSATRTIRTGDATALLGVRPYRPGDPVRDLHARSWARHGVPVVREYQEERTSRVLVILDTDVSGASESHLEAALSLAAGIIRFLGKGDELVDTLVIGDRLERLPLTRHESSLDEALDVLAAVRAGERFSAERTLASIGPELDWFSSTIVISLAWDDARARLTSILRARGANPLTVQIDERSDRSATRLLVSRERVLSGEGVSL